MSENFNFKTDKGDLIRSTVYGENNIKTNPCVILVPGFKGFKDWGFVPFISEYLEEKGYFVITFNFSHNGVGESLIEFDELEKFAENTFSLELEELYQIIDTYLNYFFGNTKNQKIGLLGEEQFLC